MNKKTTLLASLGLLVGIAAAPAYGQVWGVKVKVPFKFVVANKTLPEGLTICFQRSATKYSFRIHKVNASPWFQQMQSADGQSERPASLFERHTDVCFLSQLWTPGQRQRARTP